MARGDEIVLTLRELIATGAFAPGQRLAESPVAARLGVSRTPVRRALALLAGEGLLAPAGARGYLVRSFSFKDIIDAIEVRGLIEGMAARLVAEAGPTEAMLAKLETCVTEGHDILEAGPLDAQSDARWAAMNGRFHALIIGACGNKALVEALTRNDKLPFAAAGALAAAELIEPDLLEQRRDVLRHAQVQHELIVESLRARKSARAEALMREHAMQAARNIELARRAIPNLADEPA
jgi:GntR family transcriptional regulator, vanillate catabolism transcriptional regulator